MNKLRFAAYTALLLAVCISVSGCYNPSHARDNYPRFKEAETVNVAIRFLQWDNICIVQPEYRENGFMRFVPAEGLDKAFDELDVRRDTAVVLMGWNYDPRDIAANAVKWKDILSDQGFRRVLCLRDYETGKLNGLPVLYDWTRSATPQRTAGL
ncbi:MAG TPA: hypothetical protein PKA41_11555 [Verrucomicrobiota bacterium]|nr:hypothetical protein [Verrucomicrobiota bacterium]